VSFAPPEDVNPFDPPRAEIGHRAFDSGLVDNEAELIRRAHIGHEASIRSLGLLNYFGAIFGAIGTVGLLVMASGLVSLNQPNAIPNGPSPGTMRVIFLGVAVLYLALTLLNGGMGYGLRRLQPWARWTTVVFTALGLLYTLVVSVFAFLANPIAGAITLLVGSLIPGYILYMMVSAKGSMVFSPEYKAIILKTPHVKYKTSLIVKIFLAILLLVIGLAGVGAIMSSLQPR